MNNGQVISNRHCKVCGCVQKHRPGALANATTYYWHCLKCEKSSKKPSNLETEVTKKVNESHNSATNALILRFMEETGCKASEIEICTGMFVDENTGLSGIRTWIRKRRVG